MIFEAQVHARPIKRPKSTLTFRMPDVNMDRDTLLDQRPISAIKIRGHTLHKDQKTKEQTEVKEQNTYTKKVKLRHQELNL